MQSLRERPAAARFAVGYFLVSKRLVWLCCFLLHFVILPLSFSLPVKAGASLSPSPGDCELVASILISFRNTPESPVLVGTLAVPSPGWPRALQCAVGTKVSSSCAPKSGQAWEGGMLFVPALGLSSLISCAKLKNSRTILLKNLAQTLAQCLNSIFSVVW